MVREMITSSSLLDESEGYKSARDILHQRYGQQHLYLHEVITSLADGPGIRSRDGMAMRRLADEYFGVMQTVKSAGQVGILSHSYVTARIVARLPSAVLERYHTHSADIQGSEERFMTAEVLPQLFNLEGCDYYRTRRRRNDRPPLGGRECPRSKQRHSTHVSTGPGCDSSMG